jgi:hypothetical protein
LLLTDQWHIKLFKCAFAQQQIAYLGHVICSKGVSTDPAKVEAVKSWHVPTNCKELGGFLGLAGYYIKFVKHFGMIAKPLTELLKKGVLFVWTQDHSVAFDTLKQSLCFAPVLALPNFEIPFAIECDASGYGIGVVLLREGHPLAFVSKALGPKNQGQPMKRSILLFSLQSINGYNTYNMPNLLSLLITEVCLIYLNKSSTLLGNRECSPSYWVSNIRWCTRKGWKMGQLMPCLACHLLNSPCSVYLLQFLNGYFRLLTAMFKMLKHKLFWLLLLPISLIPPTTPCTRALYVIKAGYGLVMIHVFTRTLCQHYMTALLGGIRAFLLLIARSSKSLHGLE